MEALHNIHDVWLALAQPDLASMLGEPAGGGTILTPTDLLAMQVFLRAASCTLLLLFRLNGKEALFRYPYHEGYSHDC